jgi:hypothetical protein
MRWQRATAWSSTVGFHCGPLAGSELVDHALPVDRRDAAGQRADRQVAQNGGDGVEHVAEVG